MLKTENLKLKINSSVILNEINFELSAKEIIILLGENGSGKSMLLKTISGYYNKYYSGSILLNNTNLKKIKDNERAKIISYVSPDFNSSFSYTVYDIVEMGRYVVLGQKEIITSKDRKKIKESMETMDIWKIKDKNIGEVSTGERMRVFIARSLSTEANIILLDEPTASLDIRHKTMLFNLIKKLKEEGKSIIVSMHDLNDAVQLNTKAIVLMNGKIISTGMSSEIINEELIFNAYGVKSEKKEGFIYFK